MKTIKFYQNLVPLVLSGEKNNTWRLFDDKDIQEGDELNFIITETKEEFAKAKVLDTTVKPFKDLTQGDWEGHEKFSSNEEMYETYSGYYSTQVDENTLVKIIRFKLI